MLACACHPPQNGSTGFTAAAQKGHLQVDDLLVEFILSFSCLPSLRLNTVCACGFRRWSSCCLRGAPTLTRPKRYVCDCARVCVYVCCCFCALVAARAQPGPHSVKARASWTGGSLVLPVAPVAGEVFDDVFHFLLVRSGMRVLLVMCGGRQSRVGWGLQESPDVHFENLYRRSCASKRQYYLKKN